MEEENKPTEVPETPEVQGATNTVEEENKGLSIASMVLGIVSLVLFCIWYISLPCAILAIIFAVFGMKKGGKGMAISGLVLGIVTLAILAIFVIFAGVGLASIGSILSSMS